MTAEGSVFVDDKKVKILKDIIDLTGAKIVLSSTWRIGWRYFELGQRDSSVVQDFIELREKLLEFGIELYDKTPILDNFMRRRGDEIQLYFDNCKEGSD